MITVKDLIYTYPGKDKPTIKGIDFSIEEGEIFGFLGPSGAGKSTTQKILIGILKDYKGSVMVMNKDVSHINSNFYENIGIAFEFPNLYQKFTAYENLDFFRSLYCCETEKPADLLKLVGLEGEKRTRVSEYSKGMKVRLNFCRALLNKPRLLFLDEPTSGLDPVNADNIKKLIIQKKSEGVTVFLTTHNMHIADELCDRVGFIVDGRISLIDSPRKLKLQAGKKMVRVEFKSGDSAAVEDFKLEDIGENNRFLTLLKSGTIETIHTLEASLEDIFIKETGRSLK